MDLVELAQSCEGTEKRIVVNFELLCIGCPLPLVQIEGRGEGPGRFLLARPSKKKRPGRALQLCVQVAESRPVDGAPFGRDFAVTNICEQPEA